MSWCFSFNLSVLIEPCFLPLSIEYNGLRSVIIIIYLGDPTRYLRNFLKEKSMAVASRWSCGYKLPALFVVLEAIATGFAVSKFSPWVSIALIQFHVHLFKDMFVCSCQSSAVLFL